MHKSEVVRMEREERNLLEKAHGTLESQLDFLKVTTAKDMAYLADACKDAIAALEDYLNYYDEQYVIKE